MTLLVFFGVNSNPACRIRCDSPPSFVAYCDPVQPDILVLRTADMDCIQERGIHGIPALIIEVLSPNNPTYDTVIKHRAYAGAGVPEYWIIRPAMQNVLVCSQPDTQLRDYTHTFVVGIEETLISPTLPIQTPVANLFIGLPDSTPGGA